MAVSTWLLSLLEREFQVLRKAFPAKYPGTWLIWKPTEWRPARSEQEGNSRKTVELSLLAPPGTDAFCF